MLLLRTPDKIFLKLAIDNKNVEKQNRHYLDNTGTGRQSFIIYILRAGYDFSDSIAYNFINTLHKELNIINPPFCLVQINVIKPTMRIVITVMSYFMPSVN